MAKFAVKTGEEFSRKIYALGKNARIVVESALKGGAAVIADEIRRNIDALPTKTGVTKRGLENGLGISPIRENAGGTYDVKVGFEGYNTRGVANAEMARILESGTSRTPKHPFVRPAVSKAKKSAITAMQQAADDEIDKIMKG